MGLPRTNNDHESSFGQLKRRLRRQLGIRELREPLLRRGIWSVFCIREESVEELRRQLAKVKWETYRHQRQRYEKRLEKFRRRYRLRHRRDAVFRQRINSWGEAVSNE